MKTTIPFDGFYESIWSSELDEAEIQLAQYLTGDPDADAGDGVIGFKGREVSEVTEALYWVISYHVAQLAVAKEYAARFVDELDSECGWQTRIKFETMDSPAEYNFMTDRLFCTVPRSTVRRMKDECNDCPLRTIARERHTSCDGFISFYSPDVDTWGSVDKWDHNQVATLLAAWMESLEIEIEDMDIFETMTGSCEFSNAIDGAYALAELLERLQKQDAEKLAA